VLTAAHQIDVARPKGAMKDIGVAKVRIRSPSSAIFTVVDAPELQFTVPSMALRVVDRAMQAFGAEGISQDQPLAQMYAGLRTLRYADVSHPASPSRSVG
jgi:acyl-CoA dehydrogenase